MTVDTTFLELVEFLSANELVCALHQDTQVEGATRPSATAIQHKLREYLRLHRFYVFNGLLQQHVLLPTELLRDQLHTPVGKQLLDQAQPTLTGTVAELLTQPAACPRLQWTSSQDPAGNTYWTADSAIYAACSSRPSQYNLHPRLQNNQIKWYPCHDLAVYAGADESCLWDKLETAQAATQAREYRLLALQPADANAETA